jgi:hypothetical protein
MLPFVALLQFLKIVCRPPLPKVLQLLLLSLPPGQLIHSHVSEIM